MLIAIAFATAASGVVGAIVGFRAGRGRHPLPIAARKEMAEAFWPIGRGNLLEAACRLEALLMTWGDTIPEDMRIRIEERIDDLRIQDDDARRVSNPFSMPRVS